MKKEDILNIIKGPDYKGVIVKTIALKKEHNYINFFTSFAFANEKYLKTGDPEWLVLSGEENVGANYQELKKIVEFEVEVENTLLIRKNLTLQDFFDQFEKIKDENYFTLSNKTIKTDISFPDNEIYKIGSLPSSIFSAANSNLHRMSDVIVGWSNSDEIITPDKVNEVEINGVDIINPIETLIGFLEYYIPKELSCSVCIYFPNYTAWLSGERFAEGKQLEVDVRTEKRDFMRDLILLYKISKSNEILIWNSYKFDKVEIPKNDNKIIRFYQPMDRDIDKSLLLLIDKDFEIQDFSLGAPYLKKIPISMDVLGSKRKRRQAFEVGKSEQKREIITHRKALVTSLKHETVLFTSGDQHTAIETLKKILDRARNNIKIFDPYFGNDQTDWNIFSEIACNIKVNILTSLEFRRDTPSHFNNCLNILRNELDKVELKSVYITVNSGTKSYKKCPFHDRFFIIDDNSVWAIGTSVNGLGKRDSSIRRIDDKEDCQEIINRFNYYWLDNSPVHKEFINNSWIDIPIMRRDL